MTSRVSMLLGRTIWTRVDGGWCQESFEGTDTLPAFAIARQLEILSAPKPRRKVLIVEPCGMAHDSVETPNVGRSVFASLARIRDEFPGIASGRLGWGIEYPEAAPSGTFTTTLHVELTPGLALLRDRCCEEGIKLPTTWCAHTVAAAFAGFGSSATEAKFVVIMLPGFVGVASYSRGRRYFKSW